MQPEQTQTNTSIPESGGPGLQPSPGANPTPQPYKTSHVTYLTGMNKNNPANRHDALLEWGADNRVRLYAVDTTSGAQTTLLDCAPQDVKRFSTGMGAANIVLKEGRTFTVEFSSTVGNLLVGGAVASQFGLAGLAVGTALDQKAAEKEATTDIDWWASTFAKFGVSGLQTPAKTIYGINKVGWWVIGGLLGFTVLFLLVAFVLFMLDAAGIA